MRSRVACACRQHCLQFVETSAAQQLDRIASATAAKPSYCASTAARFSDEDLPPHRRIRRRDAREVVQPGAGKVGGCGAVRLCRPSP